MGISSCSSFSGICRGAARDHAVVLQRRRCEEAQQCWAHAHITWLPVTPVSYQPKGFQDGSGLGPFAFAERPLCVSGRFPHVRSSSLLHWVHRTVKAGDISTAFHEYKLRVRAVPSQFTVSDPVNAEELAAVDPEEIGEGVVRPSLQSEQPTPSVAVAMPTENREDDTARASSDNVPRTAEPVRLQSTTQPSGGIHCRCSCEPPVGVRDERHYFVLTWIRAAGSGFYVRMQYAQLRFLGAPTLLWRVAQSIE
jgi:hypothetical protein